MRKEMGGQEERGNEVREKKAEKGERGERKRGKERAREDTTRGNGEWRKMRWEKRVKRGKRDVKQRRE